METFSPALLARLCADPSRRRALAALILGAANRAEVAERGALTARAAVGAVDKLVEAGLVAEHADGRLELIEAAFVAAARATAVDTLTADPPHGATPEAARVLRAFVKDGRLTAIPVGVTKRQPVLDLLAQEFEPGRHYSERMVNLILGRWYPDTAALRRYLVDDGYLDRADGEYWRTGGSVT